MSRFVRSIFGNHSEKLCMRQEESGAVKGHAMAAPLLGNGLDVGLILAMHFAWILRSVLLGKSPDEGKNVR